MDNVEPSNRLEEVKGRAKNKSVNMSLSIAGKELPLW
jgi:hypothetical protein